ncbi:phage tail tape measure protein [Cytobacillus sp. Hm23]
MEEVGALRVNLGLESAEFSKSITEINRKLKAVESEFKVASAGVDGFENSIEGLQAASRNLTDKLGLQQKKVEQLRRQYEESVKTKGKDAKETENLLIRYNKTYAAMKKTESALKSTNKKIEDQTNVWKQLDKKIKEATESIKESGEKMKEVGGAITAAVTLPLTAIGVGAFKVADDFDGIQGRIQAQLGLTAEKADELADVAQELWSNAFGESIGEAANSLKIVAHNMKQLTDNELEEATEKAYILADAFEADIGDSTKIVNQLMNDFGEDSNMIFDLITTGFQNGLDYSGEFLDTLNEYSPQFAEMGYEIEEMFNVLQAGSDAGAWSLDKVGDAIKESHIRMSEMSEATEDAYKTLGLNAKEYVNKIAKGGDEGNEAFQKIVTALMEVEDATVRNQLSTDLFGTQYEDLREKVILSLTEVTGVYDEVEGATDRAGEALYDNFGTRATEVWRGFQEALLPVGEILLELAEKYLPVLAEKIEQLSAWFSDLSPEMQQLSVIAGGIAAALGPIIIVTGHIISAFASFIPHVVKVAKKMKSIGTVTGILSRGLAALTGPVGIAVAAIATITAGGIELYKHFSQDAIPEIQRFGPEVSKSTQEAVGAFLDLNDQATIALDQLAWSGTTITDEMATEIINTFAQMNEQVLTNMQEKQAEQLTSITDFYAQSSVLTEEEEAKILEEVQKYQDEKVDAIQDGQARITEIMNTAKEEKRTITSEEKAEINQIQEEMVNVGIDVMSENELEQKSIMERMKAQASDLTARQAAEVVKNSHEQTEGAIEAAEEQYNDVVKNIIFQRDEVGSITAEQAEKLIEEAQKQRDGVIEQAENMHENVITIAQTQAGEHVDEVDWETGEVLSKWDVFKNDMATKWGNIKKDASDATQQMIVDTVTKFVEMKEDASEAVEELKENVKEKFTEKVADIGTKMLEAEEKIVDAWNSAEEFLADIDLKEIGSDIIQGLIDGIADTKDDLKRKAIEIANSLPGWMKDVLGIRSPSRVMMDVGKWIPAGLAEGMEGNIGSVITATNNMAQAATPSMQGYPSSPSHSTSNNYQPNITNNYYVPVSSPSEIVRKQRQMSRQQAMGWGIR